MGLQMQQTAGTPHLPGRAQLDHADCCRWDILGALYACTESLPVPVPCTRAARYKSGGEGNPCPV